MNIDYKNIGLSLKEESTIEKLLKCVPDSDDLNKIWYLMDIVWDDYQCDNKDLNFHNLAKFYAHPVWLLNGLFIEQHDISMQHRHAISDWIIENDIKNIVDYGGGFGTLACLIAIKNTQTNVNIYEPHPSEFGLKRIKSFENIRVIDSLIGNYDCLLSTDVLEHVADPLADFSNMIKSVKNNGYLIIANCFYPVIKCHLPQNFHFRYSFNFFAKIMGLENIGLLAGSHATIFRKTKNNPLNWTLIRFLEKLSKLLFPVIELLKPILKPIRNFLIK